MKNRYVINIYNLLGGDEEALLDHFLSLTFGITYTKCYFLYLHGGGGAIAPSNPLQGKRLGEIWSNYKRKKSHQQK